MKRFTVLLLLSLILVGCVPFQTEPSVTPSPVPSTATKTLTATITFTPTITPSPTLSPTPTLTPTPTQIPFAEYELIMTLDDKVPARVVSLSFSPNGSLLVAGYNSYPVYSTGDDIIRIWDPSTGCLKYKLLNYRGINWDVSASPDGNLVVSSFWNVPEIQMWDLAGKSLIKRLETNSGFNKSFAFSPDGKLLLSIGGRNAELRSLPDGELLHTYTADLNNNLRAADFSPNGELIAASNHNDNNVFIWSVEDGELLHEITQQDDPSYIEANVYLRFSANGNLLAVSHKNKINILSVETWKTQKVFSANTEYEKFSGILFSPDDRFLVALGGIQEYLGRRRVYIWNLQDGILIKTIEIPGDFLVVTPLSMAMSPNGKFLALGQFSGRILVYGVPEDTPTGSCSLPIQIDGGSSPLAQNDVNPQSSSYIWDFETDGDVEGWKALNNLAVLRTTAGSLVTKSTGNDPYMISPMLMADATALSLIEIRMKASAGNMAEIYFITNSEGTYDESKVKRFSILGDGQFHTYTLDMSNVQKWNGVITQIRLDPTATKADIEIDYIRLTRP